MKRRPALVQTAAFGLAILVYAERAYAAGPLSPEGTEFLVNTITFEYQQHPAVAVAPDGDFVVVWHSFDGAYSFDVKAQRYDSAGSPLGSEFGISAGTTASELFPSVAAQANGDFVVVWERNEFGTYLTRSVRGQRFDSSGATVGGEFQASGATYYYFLRPSVSADGGGGFVVAWDSIPTYYEYQHSVYARRYDSSGSPVGSALLVSDATTVSGASDVAARGNGEFLVVWSSTASPGDDSSSRSIQARRFDSAGAALGSQFQVNTYTTGRQFSPSVAASGAGFAVAWASNGSSGGDSNNYSIQARRLDSAGNPAGSDFQVNAWTTGRQWYPAVAAESDGDFLVVWQGAGSSDPDGIHGRHFDSAGTPVGSELQVNTTDRPHSQPDVGGAGDGRFVVAWTSQVVPSCCSYNYDVKAQRLAELRACEDGVDNDSDGFTDAGSDPGCTDADDDSEQDPSLPCDDGLDNETPPDGLVDAADPGCGDPAWPREDPKCQNGIDDDGDGGIDFDGGASAGNPTGVRDMQCRHSWRDKEVPGACGLGFEVAPFVLLVPAARRRRHQARA